MLKKVLILTPSPGFGGLIRQLLEDTGGFQPMLVTDPVQAMHLAQKEALALTILDADLELGDFPAYISELRSHAPQTRLIVVPAEKNPENPQLAELEANAILPSPFYLPDLVAAIEQLFGPLVPQEAPNRKVYGRPTGPLKLPALEHQSEPGQAPAWLENVSQAARYLTRLSLESSSQAALITRGEQVWAYAGELPKQAADELADAVVEHMTGGDRTDLARFIHLSATNSDYMLYATGLGDEYRLALVFDARMPFSQMRTHVADLVKALATAPEGVLTRGELMHQVQAKQSETVSSHGQLHTEESPEETPSPAPQRRSPASAETPGPPPGQGQVDSDRQAVISAKNIELRCSFVLIPRLPKHRLAGDLASNLAEWLSELCLAFAWRLEEQFVQPEYLQWTVSVLPDTSPESVARTMDKHLSSRVFEQFPRLASENPSGQFWAPGFLVTSGSQPTAAQVTDFIRQTRKYQGVVS